MTLSNPSLQFLADNQGMMRQLLKELEPPFPPVYKPKGKQCSKAYEEWIYQSGRFNEFVRIHDILVGEKVE